MKVKKLVVGKLRENCYIVVNDNNDALVIDPGDEYLRIDEYLKEYKLKGILITHYHFDHIGALDELQKKYKLKVNVIPTNFNCVVIETPGHTMDSKSFYFKDINALFDGDFIFNGGIGRTDLGGNDLVMQESIKKILDSELLDVTLYPGHGPTTTIRNEYNNLKYYL